MVIFILIFLPEHFVLYLEFQFGFECLRSVRPQRTDQSEESVNSSDQSEARIYLTFSSRVVVRVLSNYLSRKY